MGEGNPGVDSFFSAVAEGLNNLPRKRVQNFTVSSLRKLCRSNADKRLRSVAWFTSALECEQQNISNYIENIGYSSEDIAASETEVLIAGRPEIEGRIICIAKKVKIHVIEKQWRSDNESETHKVVEGSGWNSVDKIDYETDEMIHIMREGGLNYKLQSVADERKNPNIRQTKGAANAKGEMYEVKLLMLLLVRGLNKTQKFNLAKNVADAGKFDDIVFEYCQHDGTNKTIFLQAKHREKPEIKRISINALLTNNDYKLTTLFQSYIKIKDERKEQNGSSIENCEFILYTNHMLGNDIQNDEQNHKTQWDDQNVNEMLRSGKGSIVQFKNNDTILTKLTTMGCEGDPKKFLGQFYLFANQADESKLGSIIKAEMKKYYPVKWDIKTVYLMVKEKVLKWWQDKESSRLTEKDELFVDAIHTQQLKKLKGQNEMVQFEDNKIAQLLVHIEKNQVVNITADESTQLLSRIQVFQALPNKDWIYVTLDTFVKIQRQVLQSFSQKTFLVIEGNWGDEHCNALRELSDAISKNINGKLILISDKPQSKILEDSFPGHLKEHDKCTLENLTTEARNKFLAKTVIFYGQKIELSHLLGEITDVDSRIINSRLLMQLINNEKITICKKPPTLSDMETAFSKQHTEVPADNFLKFLMKSSGGSCAFSIYGKTERELFRVLNIIEGGQERDVISKMIQEGHVKLSPTPADFKEFCIGKTITSYLIEVISCHEIYLKNIYNPKFYSQRRLSNPDKIKVGIDILLQEEMTEIIIIECESGKQRVLQMLESFADHCQKQFDMKCQRNQIVFQSSDENAKTKYGQLCQENHFVLWLAFDDEPRHNFKFRIRQGIMRNLKVEQDYVALDRLFNEAEQDSIFLISNAQKDDLTAMLDMWLAHRKDCFEQNCKSGHIAFNPSDTKETSDKPKHFLTVEGEDDKNFIWLHTNGSIQGLRRYVNTEENENNLISERDFVEKVNRECAIIADDPGMGKSTTLTSMSDQMLDSNWVIRVDFRECDEAIKALPVSANGYDDNLEIICEFFARVRNSNWIDDEFAKEVFKHKLKQKSLKHWPIIILFDAFDEIKDEQQRKIIVLLNVLKDKASAKIWVTTRKTKMQELEDSLSTFASEFEKLQEQQQQEFLQNIWQDRLNIIQGPTSNEFLREYAKSLLVSSSKFIRNDVLKFMGVPLQLRILAEIYKNEVAAYCQAGSTTSEPQFERLNILTMFRRFIDEKYNIYLSEKITLHNSSEYITKKLCQSFNKDHGHLALYVLFHEESNQNYKQEMPTKEDKRDLSSVGIIQYFENSDATYFIHRTFAEYFVAELFVSKLNKKPVNSESVEQFLMKEMFRDVNVVIRCFIYLMLSEENEIQMAAIENNISRLLEKDNIENPSRQFDKLGRTALHLAAQEGHLNAVKILLDGGYNALQADVFGKTCLHYATMNGHKEIIEHIIMYNADIDIPSGILKTALQIVPGIVRNKAIRPGYLSSNVAMFLNARDKKGKAILHYSVERQDWAISCTLVANGADVNLLPEVHQTQILQYAVSHLNLRETPVFDIYFQVIALLMVYAPRVFVAQGVQQSEDILQYFKKHGFGKFMEPVLNLVPGSNNGACQASNSLQLFDKFRKWKRLTCNNVTNSDLERRLRTAVQDEDLDKVRCLVNTGADVDTINIALDCALNYNIYHENSNASLQLKGRMDIIRFLLVECQAEHKYPHELPLFREILKAPTQSLLHHASTLSTTIFAEYLIDIGADVNMKDKDGRTPLYYAAIESLHFINPRQSEDMVLCLLKKGAIYNCKDNAGKTVLDYLQSQTESYVFKLLTYIDNAFNNINTVDTDRNVLHEFKRVLVCVRNVNKETFLHAAIAQNAVEIIYELLENYYLGGNGNVNAKNNQGYTPLHIAAEIGPYDIAEILLRKRASYNSLNCDGLTPKDLASRNNHDDIVQLLNTSENTFKAVKKNSLGTFKQNVSKVGYNFMDKDGNTLIHCVAKYGRLEMAKFFIKYGYDDGYNVHDWTPLHCASQYDQTEMVYFLLKNGAVYNAKKTEGRKTPMDLAATKEISDFLKTVHNIFKFAKTRLTRKVMNSLESIKANSINAFHAAINCRDWKGNRILHIAAEANDFQLVKFLILNGSSYNAKNQRGEKPKELTSDKRIKDLFECLSGLISCWEDTFQKSINGIFELKDLVNVRDKNGRTILHTMSWHTSGQINYYRLKYFIENGVNINSTDNAGGTLLDTAIEWESLDMVKFLLMNGANIGNLLPHVVERFKTRAEIEGRYDILMLLSKLEQNTENTN